eukprot:COSAG03_NODE_14857_length_449_cov_1.922857_1_plen_64_part_10
MTEINETKTSNRVVAGRWWLARGSVCTSQRNRRGDLATSLRESESEKREREARARSESESESES